MYETHKPFNKVLAFIAPNVLLADDPANTHKVDVVTSFQLTVASELKNDTYLIEAEMEGAAADIALSKLMLLLQDYIDLFADEKVQLVFKTAADEAVFNLLLKRAVCISASKETPTLRPSVYFYKRAMLLDSMLSWYCLANVLSVTEYTLLASNADYSAIWEYFNFPSDSFESFKMCQLFFEIFGKVKHQTCDSNWRNEKVKEIEKSEELNNSCDSCDLVNTLMYQLYNADMERQSAVNEFNPPEEKQGFEKVEFGEINDLEAYKLTFGQYSGRFMDEVAEENAQYLIYLHNQNAQGVRFSKEVYMQLENLAKEQAKKQFTPIEITELSDIIKFGKKHKGLSVQAVVKTDPQYIVWAHGVRPMGYYFSPEIYNMASKAAAEQKQNSYGSNDYFSSGKDDLPF